MKYIKWLTPLVGATLLVALGPSNGIAPAPVLADTSVYINEVAWAGSSLSAQDEWVELRNPGLTAVDISGWQLTKSTPAEDVMVTVPAGKSIPAGGYFVISNFDAAHSVVAIEPELVDTAITLSNTQLLLRLYSGDWHNAANLVDVAGDGGVPPAGNNTLKLSMERGADASWHDALAAVNLDTAVTDLASPAAENSELALPPSIQSINPSTVLAGESLMIESIVGENFTEPLTAKLVQGETELMAANIHLASATLIDAGSWQTTEELDGVWTLEITVGSGQVATLPDCVTISAPPPDYDLSADIRINEVFPHPSNSINDEFIELVNRGGKTVDLTGWKLDDIENGGSAPYGLTGAIAPFGFLVVYKPASKITLNDNGDSVRLIQPTGLLLDSTTYAAADTGDSWVRTASGWEWSDTPTPNGANIVHREASEPDTDPPIEEPEDSYRSYVAGSITVDELLPKPLIGEDEFVELYNNSSEKIPLAGWEIIDEAKRSYRFSEGELAPGGRLVIYKTVSRISLNDTGGESLRLLDPSGVEIASLGYPDNAVVGAAFIRSGTGGTWVSFPTPGEINPTDLVEVESEVGGWAETGAEDSLPVTGLWWGWLTGLALVFIMGWKFFHDKRNIDY